MAIMSNPKYYFYSWPESFLFYTSKNKNKNSYYFGAPVLQFEQYVIFMLIAFECRHSSDIDYFVVDWITKVELMPTTEKQ